ncbi:MAG: hypothetical protein FWG83_06585 [Oscillospiraceae bacterium]|nr:hypothetical protein [Oscillospiraceae bacterium]
MRVLSQGEIDNLLAHLLPDSSVLPVSGDSNESGETKQSAQAPTSSGFSGFSFTPSVDSSASSSGEPSGIEAFKARIAAAQAARLNENN